MGTSYARPSLRESPYQTRPRILHAIAAFTAFTFSCVPLWLWFQYFLTEVVMQLLSFAQISVVKSSNAEVPLLVVKLLDSSELSLAMTWQRCGLLSITVFGLLLLSLLHPLGASLWRKIAWLELGLLLGLTWSCLRLCVAVLISYHLGASTLVISDFLTGPLTDIFWAVAAWSLALSTLVPKAAR